MDATVVVFTELIGEFYLLPNGDIDVFLLGDPTTGEGPTTKIGNRGDSPELEKIARILEPLDIHREGGPIFSLPQNSCPMCGQGLPDELDSNN